MWNPFVGVFHVLNFKISVGIRGDYVPFRMNFIRRRFFKTQLAFSIFKSREKAKDDSSILRCINEPEVTNARMDFFSYRV